jgi:hypothetical protein
MSLEISNNHDNHNYDNNDNCPICFLEINEKTNITITNCNHKYHTSCIIQCKNFTCPLCRNDLKETNTIITNYTIQPNIYCHTLSLKRVYPEVLHFLKIFDNRRISKTQLYKSIFHFVKNEKMQRNYHIYV